jgi:hypothetical protein
MWRSARVVLDVHEHVDAGDGVEPQATTSLLERFDEALVADIAAGDPQPCLSGESGPNQSHAVRLDVDAGQGAMAQQVRRHVAQTTPDFEDVLAEVRAEPTEDPVVVPVDAGHPTERLIDRSEVVVDPRLGQRV